MKCKRYEMFRDLHIGKIEQYFKDKENESMVEQNLGMLKLPTGKIVANDPLVVYEFEPFLKTVESGEYPVVIYVHHIKTDKRVGFAEIRFTDKKPVDFELARTQNNKDVECGINEYVGYGVDSGTGGFMDEVMVKIIEAYDADEGQDYFDNMDDLLSKTYVHTYDYANYTPDGVSCNVVAFSSGYGDGVYGSYWGYDEDGELCCLLTDFQTIDIPEDEETAKKEKKKEPVKNVEKKVDPWGDAYDYGSSHSFKVARLGLPIDSIVGYNHLAVYLRWMGEHHLLSDKLLAEYPALPELIQNRETDLRYIIRHEKVFNGKLCREHFNEAGKEFSNVFYRFGKNGYPSCVDAFAEKALGTEKYNCAEFKNEGYLFVPYDEEYYQGLSKYIDEAWEKLM